MTPARSPSLFIINSSLSTGEYPVYTRETIHTYIYSPQPYPNNNKCGARFRNMKNINTHPKREKAAGLSLPLLSAFLGRPGGLLLMMTATSVGVCFGRRKARLAV